MSPQKTLVLAMVLYAAGAGFGNRVLADATRVFGVWTATCWTRDDRCAAETDAIVRTPYRLTLAVSRPNAAGADWKMGLRLRRVELGRGAGITLKVAGGGDMTLKASGYEVGQGGGSVTLTDADEAAAVIRALIAGDRANVAFASRDRGKVSRDFLINGLAAALSWINRQQGRGTSVTAQLAPPPEREPETTQPPSPPAAEAKAAAAEKSDDERTRMAANEAAKTEDAKPDIAPAPAAPDADAQADEQPPASTPEKTAGDTRPEELSVPKEAAPAGVPDAMIARHQQKSDCDAYGGGALKELEARRAPLSGDKALYLVPCYASGGTVASRLYVARGGDVETARTLYFANFSPSLGWYGSDTLINPAYDAETGLLTAGGTGGGTGCGNAARYRWDGFDFRLLEYRASDECGGPADPAAWPLIYEARPGKS